MRLDFKLASCAFIYLWLGTNLASAQIAIDIDPQFQRLYASTVTVDPSQVFALTIYDQFYRGDKLVVQVDPVFQNSEVYVVDVVKAPEIQIYAQERTGLFPPDNDRFGGLPIAQTGDVSEDAQYAVVLRNKNYMTRTPVKITIFENHTLTPQEVAVWRQHLDSFLAPVTRMFAFPPFRVRVFPCSAYQAYFDRASGDIIVCSEILWQAGADPQLNGQLQGVLYHELGHKLLYAWGFPYWKNESDADDFAVYMLLQQQGGIGMTANFSRYFQASDIWAENAEINDARRGDPHPLGAQRFQAIQSNIVNAEDFMSRCNTIYYQKMKTEYLARILGDHHNFESPDVAREILIHRPAQ